MLEHKFLIDGKFVDALDQGVIEVENPSDKSILGTVPRGLKGDTDLAVEAAQRAFTTWLRTPPKTRSDLLLKVADRIDEMREEIAQTISRENGNALRTQSRGEATLAADVFRYFGGLARELKGSSQYLGRETLDLTRRQPFGVVGAIVPWNAPLLLTAQKIAPALCTGNTIVVKASEAAPLAVLKLAEICAEFFPPGTVNVITGYGPESGAPLAEHPAVRKLSFTGSTAVGKSILAAASDRIVPVSLELGGKSAQIVMPDADPAKISMGVVSAMRFTRQGQSCTAGSRLFVHEDIADDLVREVTAQLEKLVVGDPLDEATDIGAIVNEKQFSKVCTYIESALEMEATTLVTGGLPDESLAGGYYLRPTVLSGIPDEATLNREEIFGPVMSVATWREESEVIARANNTEYGLAGYVWGENGAQVLRIADQLEAGWVMINQGGGQLLGHSYGGMKQSGMGRELSLEGMLDSYTWVQQLSMNMELPQ